jgi:hypothetical protein
MNDPFSHEVSGQHTVLMANPTVVAVYGIPAGQRRVQRLGSGSLPLRELVLVDPPLDDLLGSAHPPRVLRVGLGSVRSNGEVFVEVREVLQVLQSIETQGETMWALELTEPAESPVTFGASQPASPPPLRIDLNRLADILRQSQPGRPKLPSGPRRPIPPRPDQPPIVVPAGLWCVLFPRARFCRR